MTERIRIKICCISTAKEAQLAEGAGADLLGLVGPMPSGPGVLDHDAAAEIAGTHRGVAAPVLLTSSETCDAITADAGKVGVGHVQIVRHIAPKEAEHLARAGLVYIQVIHVEDESALDLIAVYAPYCDFFLLDSGRPSRNALGGTGRTHDWSVSAEFVRRAPRPVFLAGGLSPDNIREAIETVRPFGVDICSGVRRAGKLDPALLQSYVSSVRRAQNASP